MGFLKSISVETLLACLHQILNGLGHGLTLLEVIGQGLIEFREPVLKKLLHDLTDLLMDVLTLRLEETVVDHLLGEGMLEDVLQVGLE